MSKIKYLPLAYVERYENLTDIYCSKGHFDCEPDVLLDMIADEKWGESDYSGPNIQGYKLMFETAKNNFLMMHKASPCFAVAGFQEYGNIIKRYMSQIMISLRHWCKHQSYEYILI